MAEMSTEMLEQLLKDVRACTICADILPMGPRPVLQVEEGARILIVGQAPGIRVHETGIPFNDPSGDRLRDWMGVDRETFYDASKVALIPMGFCYPGSLERGDVPPPPICAQTWRQPLIDHLPDVALTLVLGQHAQGWHLKGRKAKNLTETVKNWREFAPDMIPLPHPSPRNNIWLKKNPWFADELLPVMKERVAAVLG